MSGSLRPPNDEVIARLYYVTQVGTPDLKAAAKSRIEVLRAAYQADKDNPSSMPVLPIIETEIWNWWHKMSSQAQAENELRGPVPTFPRTF